MASADPQSRKARYRMSKPAALVFVLLFTGCVLCPSMDENCWLMRKMNGESEGNGRMTPEEACTGRGGTAILKAGEFDRCSDGQ